MDKVTLGDDDFSTLSNICRSAAQKYEEIAGEFRKAEKARSADEVEPGMPWGRAAGSLADQFDRQRADAIRFADTFDMAVAATLEVDPGEDEEHSPAP